MRPPSTLAAAEPSAWSAAHAHAGTAKNLAADRAQARRCARPAYRRHHPARCPATQPRPGTQRAADAGDPAATGRWAAPFAVPTWAIHAVLLPTGKVLWLSKRQDETAGGDAHLYDPATGTVRAVTPPSVRYPDGSVEPANLFCAGQALLPDGRVLVAGGNLAYYESDAPGESWKGARWLFTFDPWTETWTRQSTDMAKGRWYPTVTTLPDGRALITGGWDESGNDVSDDDMEVFTPSPRMNGADGTVTKVGTRPWSQLYPHMFVIPDTTAAGAGSAKVLMAGPMGRYPANAGILDTATWKWSSIPFLPTNREFGGAVMLPGGPDGPSKVLLTGGSDAPFDTTPTATTAVLDLNAPGAGFQPGPPLLTARTHGNVVALPDGSVMEVGGGGGTSDPTDGSIYDAPVYRSELLDPGASAFRAADVQREARTYHATALLLPDGRVLSAGDDRASHATDRTAELYSPPYLFRGARTRITFAPSTARYDARIRVGTPDPDAIAKAVLMRPSSVTHVTDMDARSMTLALTAEDGGLTLRTPRNGTVAPPGWYMLFLLDRDGVPSVASWIRLDPSAPDAPEIPGGGGGAAAPPGTGSGSGDGNVTTGTPTATRDRVAPRVTLAVAAPSHAANGTLTAVVRVRTGERAGLRVRVALGRREVVRTLRAAPGAWATATVRFGHAPRHAFLHVKVRAADAAGNARTAVRTVRF